MLLLLPIDKVYLEAEISAFEFHGENVEFWLKEMGRLMFATVILFKTKDRFSILAPVVLPVTIQSLFIHSSFGQVRFLVVSSLSKCKNWEVLIVLTMF